MKTKRAIAVMVILLGLLAGREAQAFYNPSTGRWLSRDPIGERAFAATHSRDTIRGKVQRVTQKTSGSYVFVQNAVGGRCDYLGLEPRLLDSCPRDGQTEATGATLLDGEITCSYHRCMRRDVTYSLIAKHSGEVTVKSEAWADGMCVRESCVKTVLTLKMKWCSEACETKSVYYEFLGWKGKSLEAILGKRKGERVWKSTGGAGEAIVSQEEDEACSVEWIDKTEEECGLGLT